jgi:hypothetical protein
MLRILMIIFYSIDNQLNLLIIFLRLFENN